MFSLLTNDRWYLGDHFHNHVWKSVDFQDSSQHIISTHRDRCADRHTYKGIVRLQQTFSVAKTAVVIWDFRSPSHRLRVTTAALAAETSARVVRCPCLVCPSNAQLRQHVNRVCNWLRKRCGVGGGAAIPISAVAAQTTRVSHKWRLWSV